MYLLIMEEEGDHLMIATTILHQENQFKIITSMRGVTMMIISRIIPDLMKEIPHLTQMSIVMTLTVEIMSIVPDECQ
jgi:hypothetical protein